MKTLARQQSFTIGGQTYLCDVLLGLYASEPRRPAILLGEHPTQALGEQSPSLLHSDLVAVASVNPPSGFLIGQPASTVTIKDYAENAGLEEQLVHLLGTDGRPLFKPLLTTSGHHKAITLGFATARLYTLENEALSAFQSLLEELHS